MARPNPLRARFLSAFRALFSAPSETMTLKCWRDLRDLPEEEVDRVTRAMERAIYGMPAKQPAMKRRTRRAI